MTAGQEDIHASVGEPGGDEAVSFVDGQGDDPSHPGVGVGHQLGLFHRSLLGGGDDVFALGKFLHRQDGHHLLARSQMQQVDDGLAPRGPAALGNLVDLEPVDLAEVGEDKDVGMGGGDEEPFDEILLLRAHAGFPLAATALGPVEGNGVALDVAAVGDGDHHVLLDDQVLQGELPGFFDDFRAAGVAVAFLDLEQLVLDDGQDLHLARQDLFEPLDQRQDVVVLGDDLVALQAGEPVQAHVEDRLGLEVGEFQSLRSVVRYRCRQLVVLQVGGVCIKPCHETLFGLGGVLELRIS